MKKQAVNPYLPSWEYVPDGEPHVFGQRLYVYGSHDRFGGSAYCENDYVCWSAPVTDLSDWRYEGIIYRKEQDLFNQEARAKGEAMHMLYAPDVAQGRDGKYYLYYCPVSVSAVGVAVSDVPEGPFRFLDYVRDKQGNIVGTRPGDYIQFDPGILVEEGGVWLYTGNGYINCAMCRMFKHNHSMVTRLEDDMLTAAEGPKPFLPDIRDSKNTSFYGHEILEASSIRKIKDTYYFVYSDKNGHNLCYATSKQPDRDFLYRGVIISNGDIGLCGRKGTRHGNFPVGNNHGGLVQVNGQWYIFYHRHTNGQESARQGCAEKITIAADGGISQVKKTSCGLNDGPLRAEGEYGAYIACVLTNKRGRNSYSFRLMKPFYPYMTQDGEDREGGEPQYAANLTNGCYVGFRYFNGLSEKKLTVQTRGTFKGKVQIFTDPSGSPDAEIKINASGAWEWSKPTKLPIVEENRPLYFRFVGRGTCEFLSFRFETKNTCRDV